MHQGASEEKLSNASASSVSAAMIMWRNTDIPGDGRVEKEELIHSLLPFPL